ncbi:MAG: alkaline phosphatase family protein [Bacteroidota bacterium]
MTPYKKAYCILLAILIMSPPLFSFSPHHDKKPPKLVIGLVIDQMSNEYLKRYWDDFGKKGFKRLMNEGVFFNRMSLPYFYTSNAAGYATLFTGATPADHGIIADQWYQSLTNEIVTCTGYNNRNISNEYIKEESLSPGSLISTTLGDEMKKRNPLSKVYTISPDHRAAILSGGHTADAAFWIDKQFGNWVSSQHYLNSFPSWIRKFNDKRLIDIYLGRTWNCILPEDHYQESLPDKNKYEEGIYDQSVFPYDLANLRKKTGYKLIRSVPEGNTYTKDFALATIMNMKLGADHHPDLLNIIFSTNRHIERHFGPRSVEMQDTYLRLDRDIGHLLEYIDDHFKQGEVLLFLTSCNGPMDHPDWLKDQGLPGGYFKSSKALYLLRTYLDVLYGQKELVKFVYKQQIYLDRNLINNENLPLKEIQNHIAQFMVQFNGVADAVPAHVLRENNFNEGLMGKIKNNYCLKRSGDVMIILKPGWKEYTEEGNTQQHGASLPLFLYGWNLPAQKMNQEIFLHDLAPTLSEITGACKPALCTGKSLLPLMKLK